MAEDAVGCGAGGAAVVSLGVGVVVAGDAGLQVANNLARGDYVRVDAGFGTSRLVTDITERALREVGTWPNDGALADQLLWLLETKVEQATSPDERKKWQRILSAFGAAGREFTIEVAGALAARQMGA